MKSTYRTNTSKATLSARGKTPIDAALRCLSSRARTVHEVHQYLIAHEYTEEEAQEAVSRMLELGYLNDAEFAAEFIRTRLNTKPISRRALSEQLRARGLDETLIDNALSLVTDDMEWENALETARKYYAQLYRLPPDLLERRLYSRLAGRGYSHEDTRAALRAVMEEDHA